MMSKHFGIITCLTILVGLEYIRTQKLCKLNILITYANMMILTLTELVFFSSTYLKQKKNVSLMLIFFRGLIKTKSI